MIVAGNVLSTGRIDMTQLFRLARIYIEKEVLDKPHASVASRSGQGGVSQSVLVGEANACMSPSADER